MTKSRRRPHPLTSVSYTIRLKWTIAAARRWHRKNGTLNNASFREFLEEAAHEMTFEEFTLDFLAPGADWNQLLPEVYFNWVADRL